jgi:hypothetical protein
MPRWRTFIDDAGKFLDSGWASRCVALGWGPLELFGADRDKPFARVDRLGLVWLLNGRRLLAISDDTAAVENRNAPPHTYRRVAPEKGRVALAWNLALIAPISSVEPRLKLITHLSTHQSRGTNAQLG